MATAREIGSFGGLRIVFSVNALEATKVRKFPASRHRSQRIRKKLMKQSRQRKKSPQLSANS
jgi:hypothetical protein